MNINKKVVFLSILSILYLIFNIIFFYSFPFFADGAIYCDLIRDNTPRNIFSFEYKNFPPLFFFISSVINKLIKNVSLTTILTTTIPIILLVFTLFLELRRSFNENVAFWSAVALLLSPMFLWTISHRLMDPLSYFLMVLMIVSYLQTLRKRKISLLLIPAAFLLPMSKQTSLISLAIVIFHYFSYSIFKVVLNKKIKPDISLITVPIIIVFFVGGMLLSHNSYKNLLNKVPFINLFLSQTKEIKAIDKLLTVDQQIIAEEINDRFIIKNDTMPYFFPLLKKMKVRQALQYFYPLPISSKSNKHWFSPAKNYFDLINLFFLSFLVGLILIFREKNNLYGEIILSTLIASVFFFPRYAIKRYVFIIPIVVSVFFGLFVNFILNIDSSASIKTARNYLFKTLFFLLLIQVFVSEISDISQYKNIPSRRSAPYLISTLKEIRTEFPEIIGKTIFVPHSEPIYYLNADTVWDWRLFLVSEEEKIMNYLRSKNVSYLIIPAYSLSPYASDGLKQVENTVQNLANSKVIPTGTVFYDMLIKEDYFPKLKEYGRFTLYRI